MEYGIAKIEKRAELTEGKPYELYGRRPDTVIVRNDSGLLVSYRKEYFKFALNVA